MRKPNPTHVTKALVAELLPKSVTGSFPESKFHDVVLQTSDNHKVPALRAVLAIRSPFFATLLYGPFAESASKTVAIDLTQRSLTQILHFIYSDDSPTLRRIDNTIRRAGHGFRARRNAWDALTCRDIHAASDVIAAADFCQIHALTKWGCALIMKAVRVKQGLACTAFQAIVERGGVCNQLVEVKEKLLEYIVKYVQGCFAVPHVLQPKSLAARKCFGHVGKCGVMHLGEDAFKMVFDRLKESDSEWRRMAILFHCLYFWAADGRQLFCALEDKKGEGQSDSSSGKQEKDGQTQKRVENSTETKQNGNVQNPVPVNVVEDPTLRQTSPQVKTEIDMQSSRWRTAMACAEVMEAPSSKFLVTFMEPSGLLSRNALFKCYRDATKRNVGLENEVETQAPLSNVENK